MPRASASLFGSARGDLEGRVLPDRVALAQAVQPESAQLAGLVDRRVAALDLADAEEAVGGGAVRRADRDDVAVGALRQRGKDLARLLGEELRDDAADVVDDLVALGVVAR